MSEKLWGSRWGSSGEVDLLPHAILTCSDPCSAYTNRRTKRPVYSERAHPKGVQEHIFRPQSASGSALRAVGKYHGGTPGLETIMTRLNGQQ